MHSNLLIVGILTVGFALASILAYMMQRLRLPSILGYLLAGYFIGPYSPGYVADSKIAEQLAEIGVILMLFGVGLHFKIEDLVRVKNIAIPGAIGQTVLATISAAFVVYYFGGSLESGLIIGVSVGVASTVVLVRILTDNNVLDTEKGHIAVGWLIVEDIFTVIVLLLLPTLATSSAGGSFSFVALTGSIFFVIAKFSFLAFFMFTWGQKIIEFVLMNVARLRSQELFTLTVIALIFLVATGSSVVFGTSIALGAFISGMVIGKTTVRHQAAANALPLKDIFAVVFFLSVGMLFNPQAIEAHYPLFIGIIAVILFVKPLVAYLITRFFGYSLNTALTVAISLAQIGEFSFILAEEAMNLQLIHDEAFDILVACALISISLNPLFFQMIGSIEAVIQKFTFIKRGAKKSLDVASKEEKLPSRVLIVGFGPIGKEVLKIVQDAGCLPIIIEENIDTVSSTEEKNDILFGDAEEATVLKAAHIQEASYLLITIPDTKKSVKIIHAARLVKPSIQIIARAQYTNEKPLLEGLNVTCICTEVEALKAFALETRHILRDINSGAGYSESLQ